MKKILDIIISVDWEGLSLDPINLNSLSDFKNFYQCPLTHYLSPAYWTNPKVSQSQFQQALSTMDFISDEIGLHLHAPKHFLDPLEIPFRSRPSFSIKGDQNDFNFIGQEVMLLAYSKDEFAKMINESFKIFKNLGLAKPNSFRAGGWMIDPDQIDTLSDLGFLIESSAVPPDFFNNTSWQDENIHRYAKVLWPEISFSSQPSINSKILQIPNNWGAIDYWQDQTIPTQTNHYLSRLNTNERNLIVLTTHQETFFETRPRLEKIIDHILNLDQYDIQFLTNKDILRRCTQKSEQPQQTIQNFIQ